MNSQQIAYFLEVVRQGSFTKAAQVLYTSQPSLSRQIARLEDEFGAELFCRSRTGAVLSPIGKKYYDLFVEMERSYWSAGRVGCSPIDRENGSVVVSAR